jgi:hypothetical protein
MLMAVPPERWRKMVRRQAACVAPAFDLSCQLVYDAYGLVVDYPGIAVRVGRPDHDLPFERRSPAELTCRSVCPSRGTRPTFGFVVRLCTRMGWQS